MYPRDTHYTLASAANDFRDCYQFFRQESQHPRYTEEGFPAYEKEKIETPVVIARRTNQVVGVVASRFLPDHPPVAAPFHVSYNLKNHVPVALRLIDCYEHCLREAGVPEYLVLMPNYKSSAVRVFEDLCQATLLRTVYNDRFNLYLVPVER